MINQLLKAKHWQLFLLTFGIPLVFQFVMLGTLLSNIEPHAEPNPEVMLYYMQFFPIVIIISMGALFGWLWSVAVGLQDRMPAGVKMKVRKFKIFFFIPIIYISFISVFMGVGISGLMDVGDAPSPALIGGMVAIIVPLHLFSMFCMFYTLYFVSKTIKTVELQREVKFSDFAGEFFMIWFYPIGIWIVQPKINEMTDNKMHSTGAVYRK